MTSYRTSPGTKQTDYEYNFLVDKYGEPAETAEKIMNSLSSARMKYSPLTDRENIKAAVLYGANGRCAVSLSALGAKVTLFLRTNSEKKYAAAAAKAAGVKICCKVCGMNCFGLEEYGEKFDALLFSFEDLNRFYDISELIKICRGLLVPDGVLIFGSFDSAAENMLYTDPSGVRKHSLADMIYAANTGGFRIKSVTEYEEEIVISAEMSGDKQAQ